MGERVLTLRELSRATLARQLLLERKRLSPTAVIERLVGMQAQWPPAPYVGIWTRTTSFRREALERALTNGTVVKATVMRQTLHLVTLRDYALVRAAMSETSFPWETSQAKLLASSVRALAADRPVTSAEGLAHVEREHGLTGLQARRAWRSARARAHLVHHHETALWRAPRDVRFVALEDGGGDGAGIGHRIATVSGHHADDDAPDPDGVGDSGSRHARKNHVRDHVDVAEATAKATDKHKTELQQAVSQATDVHQVGSQDEQGNSEQDVRIEQPIEDLFGSGAEVETRQQQIQDRAGDHGMADRQAQDAEQNDRDDAAGKRRGHRHSGSWAGSLSGGFAPRIVW